MKPEQPLHVVHVVASLAEASGGPPRSVVSLCERLGALGCRVDIVTLENEHYFGPAVAHDPALVTVHRVPSRYFKPLRLISAPGFARALARVAAGADLIHAHGIWLSVNHAAAQVARRLAVPHVISVRGNFLPAALASSAWKKKLARRFFVDADVRGAGCLHATSPDEARLIRGLGFKNPIAVLPAGVTLPGFPPEELSRRYAARWPELRGKRVLLFLGRVHPHKGIFYLAQAWAQLARQHPDWHLVVAGADEIGCQQEAQAQLAAAGGAGSCSFVGTVSGADKWALLAHCGLLTLPSRSENFGHAVAEALAAGRPVLTTDTTPWADLERFQCGWRIPVGAAALQQKLSEVLALPAAELDAMGRRGIQLIQTRYEATSVARQMRGVYQWLAKRAERPACVESPDVAPVSDPA